MLRTGTYNQMCPVLFGSGVVAQVGEKAKEAKITKAMVVTDPGIEKIGHEKKVVASLNAAGIDAVVWAKAEPDCPADSVAAGAAVARAEKVDGIIGIGGGSSLDTAKAIAVIAPNTDEILQDILAYRLWQKFYDNDPYATILVPTTAGTGSECTFMAVINDPTVDGKMGLPSKPTHAVVDPELTLGTPNKITASCGLDAFSHANEALTAMGNTPHSDVLAYEVIRRITKWLPVACKEPQNIEAREHVMFASNIAGITFNEAGVHIGHSIAHAVGYVNHLPHGIGCALVTPPIIEFVATQFPEKMRLIAEAMGITIKDSDLPQVGKITADAVRKLMKEVGIQPLKELNISREETINLIKRVEHDHLCDDFSGKFNRDDVIKILESMYDDYNYM